MTHSYVSEAFVWLRKQSKNMAKNFFINSLELGSNLMPPLISEWG